MCTKYLQIVTGGEKVPTNSKKLINLSCREKVCF